MKMKSLHIKNFKSIVDVTLNEPNPFTVFVGSNGSGKSNIFEALEFAQLMTFENDLDKKIKIENSFGGSESLLNFKMQNDNLVVGYDFHEDIIVFTRTLKDEKLLELITQAKEQLNENKVKIIDYLSKLTSDNKETNKIKLLFSTDRFDKFLLPKYDSLSFTVPLTNDFINSLDTKPVINTFNLENILGLAEEHFNGVLFEQFFSKFSRIFIGSRIGDKSNHRKYLKSDASNLEMAVSFILKNNDKRQDLVDWLRLFIPEFEDLEYGSNGISSKKGLQIFAKNYNKPFTKDLISDGTYNIIALLTAVLQSDEPQFLCIEEPENGLNPMVVKELVNFFRDACEEKGHYIWLNTHSQTLVSQLKEEEMIVVDKVNGETKIKQFKKGDFFGMPADEALLTNSLGGGLPW